MAHPKPQPPPTEKYVFIYLVNQGVMSFFSVSLIPIGSHGICIVLYLNADWLSESEEFRDINRLVTIIL